MLTRTINDELLVTSPKIKEDKVDHGILSLNYDPEYHPDQHARCYAEIVTVPDTLSKYWNSDDLKFIKPKKRVYFDYRGLIHADDFGRRFGDYFLIPWRWLYCVIEDNGDINVISGWTIGEEVYDSNVEEVEVDGQKIKVAVGESGLVTTSSPKPKKQHARLLHIGGTNPRTGTKKLEFQHDGEDLGLKKGDVVYHHVAANFPYNIEGEDVFVINQSLILGKIE